MDRRWGVRSGGDVREVEGGLRGFWGRVRRDVEPNYETIFPRTVQPRTVQPWVAPIGLKLIPYTRPSGSGRGPGSGRGRPLCGRPKRERKPPYPPAIVPVRSAPVRSAPVRSAPVRSAPVRSAPVRSAPVRSAPVRSPAMSASLRPQLRPPGPGFAPGGAADLRASPALVFLCSCLPEGLWERPRMVGCEWPEHDVRPQTEDRSTGGALAEPRRRKTPLVLPRKLSGERLKGRGFAQPPEPGPLPQRERQRGSCL